MPAPPDRTAWQVFLVFLRLGLTSFGGPVAHLGYFRTEFVERRRWLSEAAYADLVALCQFLPGPASSQVGLALGLMRAGYAGALAAWAGFTQPSALALIALALGIAQAGEAMPGGALHGLKVVAVAVVAQAVWGMARSLCPDAPRRALMVVTAGLLIAWPGTAVQLLAIGVAAVIGLLWLQPAADAPHEPLSVPVGRRAGAAWLGLFLALLAVLPLLLAAFPSPALAVVDAFYRTGALVFGGGHVVLPLLQASVVPTGWVGSDTFLAGYGAAQAVPGPLSLLQPSSARPCTPPPPAGPADCRRWRPSSRPPSCWWPVHCRSGTACVPAPVRARPSWASTPPSSACCWPRCGTRSSPAASAVWVTCCWPWPRWSR